LTQTGAQPGIADQAYSGSVGELPGMLSLSIQRKLLKKLEARAGIEPAHKGFADLSLTTWVPRLGLPASSVANRPIPRQMSAPFNPALRNGAGDET
jgi:hypothetical protein